ncbi:MAG: ROK family protein [Candidatus Omnitrophica bacterium]|nr:ROK family protein [Candidatus Omnitrophota bacterium]MBU1047453.1 ROK family protein [Candidatus Omnitrophota bacterium]MBU1766862.1 ROK family protein [Candidatus Omnitrophota bacterium]MBU1888816.1 ROK family protein [Candidatus Omnitrophota bacterium]
MKKIIGLDLGGTFIKIGVVDENGEILEKTELPTPQGQGRAQVIKVMSESINNCLNDSSRGKFLGIGIGTPGLVDEDGKVFLAPNLPDWNNLNLKKIFEEKFSIPVKVENDANAITWGEYKFGAGKGYDNIICITLGTGLGGGVVLNGKLLRGTKYSAVEMGHIPICYKGPKCGCGNLGCIESYVGAKYIVRATQEKLKKQDSLIKDMVGGDITNIIPKIISEAYHKGDKVAEAVWVEVGTYLGAFFSGLVNLLNPQVIIIGGGVAQVGEILFSTIKKVIDERSFSLLAKEVKVVPAKLGKDAGIVSAASLFLS